jgi:nucleotide-binding universal stress UspA family protein
MYRKILVGYRHDRHGRDALALGRALAAAGSVKDVVLAEVVDHATILRAESRTRAAEQRLEDAAGAWPQGVRVTARAAVGGTPAEALLSLVESEGADLVVLGSTHRGFTKRVLMGTTAGSILSRVRVPVAIAPTHFAQAPSALRAVGVAFDGFVESRAALRWAADFASKLGAELKLVAVVEPLATPLETWGGPVPAEAWGSGLTYVQTAEWNEGMQKRISQDLVAAAASVGRTDAATVVVVGDARHELETASNELDLLVVGSHRRGRVEGVMLGSVSRGLAHSCAAALVVVPSPGDMAQSGDESNAGAAV